MTMPERIQQIKVIKAQVQGDILSELHGIGVEYFAEIEPVPIDDSPESSVFVTLTVNPIFYDTHDRGLPKPKIVVGISAEIDGLGGYFPMNRMMRYRANILEPTGTPRAPQITSNNARDIARHLVYFILDAMFKLAFFKPPPIILPSGNYPK